LRFQKKIRDGRVERSAQVGRERKKKEGIGKRVDSKKKPCYLKASCGLGGVEGISREENEKEKEIAGAGWKSLRENQPRGEERWDMETNPNKLE